MRLLSGSRERMPAPSLVAHVTSPAPDRSAPCRVIKERRGATACATMALFHVARYAGPEASELGDAEAEAGSRARVLLERLQNRARERQQREPKPESAEVAAEAAGKRRRRPRRRRGVSGSVVQSPEAPRAKRQKTDHNADAGGLCV